MPAERLKLFVTLTSKRTARVAGLFLALAAGSLSLPAGAAERFKCSPSPKVLDDALTAYQRNDHAAARQRFECLIAQGDDTQKFYSTFYLARIYGDNNSRFADHEKALTIFSDFLNQYGEMDSDDLRRAPFVAKAYTAVGLYALLGSVEAGIKVDVPKAVQLFRRAATMYDEPDAQFELAKLLLNGEGIKHDSEEALHFLQKLSKESHAGAQAFLADLMWRGKYVQKKPMQAFALIQFALENATAADRIWIEDNYQYIYCGLGEGVRKQSTGLVGAWRQEFLKPRTGEMVVPDAPTPGLSPTRTCSNGEPVIFPPARTAQRTAAPPTEDVRPAGSSSLGGEPQRR